MDLLDIGLQQSNWQPVYLAERRCEYPRVVVIDDIILILGEYHDLMI